jgi:hypothetical protein
MTIKTGMQIYQEIAEEENPDKEAEFRYLEYFEVRHLMKFIDQRVFTSKKQSDFNLGFQYALFQLQRLLNDKQIKTKLHYLESRQFANTCDLPYFKNKREKDIENKKNNYNNKHTT